MIGFRNEPENIRQSCAWHSLLIEVHVHWSGQAITCVFLVIEEIWRNTVDIGQQDLDICSQMSLHVEWINLQELDCKLV